jgi:putative ABC transport system permease protein
MAVRLALGATPARVLSLVLGQALAPVAVGVGLGLAASIAATKLIEALLFGVTASDPWTFVATVSVLTLVTLCAAYLPARRALTIQPVHALRAE